MGDDARTRLCGRSVVDVTDFVAYQKFPLEALVDMVVTNAEKNTSVSFNSKWRTN